jgi:uncharacterized protein
VLGILLPVAILTPAKIGVALAQAEAAPPVETVSFGQTLGMLLFRRRRRERRVLMKRRLITGLGAIIVCGYAVGALAAPSFPPLTGRVVDEADIIPPAVETEIASKLAALEAKTTDQLVVATLPSLQGYDIADFGYQLGRHWAIGQEDKNNGVLLIVAPNEREVRIEVGYGLEGDLTDALTKIIIENAIIPHFKEDDMPAGIGAGVDDIIKVLTGEDAEIQELLQRQSDEGSDDAWEVPAFVIILAIWVALILLTHLRRRKGRWVWVAGSGSSSGSSRGWSSGGSSGGGFSGGGGSFGGGGSSGRW